MSLPTDEADRLSKLRDSRNLRELRGRVRALRRTGWSLSAIAQALSTHRSTVRTWERHRDFAPVYDEVPRIPTPAPSSGVIVPGFDLGRLSRPVHASTLPYVVLEARSPRLSLTEVSEIRELSSLARKVRARTPPSATYRAAADLLDARLVQFRARGIPVEDLAEAAKLTARAIRARLSDESLPPQPSLLNSVIYPSSYLLLLTAAPSGSRRWYTYVTEHDRRPVAFPFEVINFPAHSLVEYFALTPKDAEIQLGWRFRDTLLLGAGT